MSVTNVLAGVAVKDLEAAVAWYRQLLDRAPTSRPMEEVAEWEFTNGGWLQLFHDPMRAGASSMTLVDSDLDKRRMDLHRKGIDVVSSSAGDFVKTIIVKDPDGNQLVFAEAQTPENRSAAS